MLSNCNKLHGNLVGVMNHSDCLLRLRGFVSLIFTPVVDAQVREQITGEDSPPPAKPEAPPGQPYLSRFFTLISLLFY